MSNEDYSYHVRAWELQLPQTLRIERYAARIKDRKYGTRHKKPEYGRTNHELYPIWRAMINRCTSPNNPAYHNYGGRGITVCTRWLESFWYFLADMGDRPEGLTLERVDNDQGYSPENCKWATRKEQTANQRPRKKRSNIKGVV